MSDYRQLQGFQKAHQLALDVYASTASFPRAELFGITAQLRRSATSVPINLAEGAGRGSRADFARFVDVAIGSINETECLILLSRDFGYLDEPEATRLTADARSVRRLLVGLRRSLRAGREPEVALAVGSESRTPGAAS